MSFQYALARALAPSFSRIVWWFFVFALVLEGLKELYPTLLWMLVAMLVALPVVIAYRLGRFSGSAAPAALE